MHEFRLQTLSSWPFVESGADGRGMHASDIRHASRWFDDTWTSTERSANRRLGRTLEPLNEALEVLVEPDHAWAATYLPDVLIYQKAVASALEHREFHDVSQLEVAKGLIEDGLARAAHLLNGRAPWASKQGLVVRGYRSRIDDSIQPYGLVVPENWDAAVSFPFPMDVWLHGRDNRLTELKFIEQRQRSAGTLLLPTPW